MTVNLRITVKLLLEGFRALIIYQTCIKTCPKIPGLNSSLTASAMSHFAALETGLKRLQYGIAKDTYCFPMTCKSLSMTCNDFLIHKDEHHPWKEGIEIPSIPFKVWAFRWCSYTNQKQFFWNKGRNSDPNFSIGLPCIYRLKHACYMKAEPK